MSWVAVAIAGSAIVGGFLSSNAQEDAANTAANAQIGASQAGIAEQRRQFDAIQKLLSPYAEAGTGALFGQQALIGLKGGAEQQSAINALQASPAFTSMTQTGENAILQNASATGGLRGGNVQASLAQFRPQLLAALIERQFQNLGGLTSVGQNAAAGVGNAGMQTGNVITGLLGQQGAAQAGAALAGGTAQANLYGGIGGSIGQAVILNRVLGGGGGISPAAPSGFFDPSYESGLRF